MTNRSVVIPNFGMAILLSNDMLLLSVQGRILAGGERIWIWRISQFLYWEKNMGVLF